MSQRIYKPFPDHFRENIVRATFILAVLYKSAPFKKFLIASHSRMISVLNTKFGLPTKIYFRAMLMMTAHIETQTNR